MKRKILSLLIVLMTAFSTLAIASCSELSFGATSSTVSSSQSAEDSSSSSSSSSEDPTEPEDPIDPEEPTEPEDPTEPEEPETPEVHAHVWDSGEITEQATCTANGNMRYTCTVDGCEEYYDEVVAARGHLFGKWTSTKQATCTEDGEETRVCAFDSTHVETKPIAAHGHNFGAWTESKLATCTTKGEETRICSYDSTHKETRAIDAHGHLYGSWSVTTAATCEGEGEKTRYCVYDRTHTEKESIPAKGHSYGEYVQTTAPTCENKGVETKFCANDSKHTQTREIAAKGHSYGAYEVYTAATCESKGEERSVCAHDSTHYKTREIAAIGHSYGEWTVTVAPTCENKGVETSYCANNPTHTQTREISATGHSYGDWTLVKAPTLEEEGIEERVCAHDTAHKETRAIAKLEHNYGEWTVTVAPTCESKGVETRVCANDPTHVETREIAAKGHSYGEWTITTAPTCENKGEETRVCANDSTHKDTREIAAKGHSYGEWTESKAATCSQEGEEIRYCANDSTHKETRATDMIGHDYGEWTVTTAPTCEDKGEETRICSYDSTHVDTREISATGHNYGAWTTVVAATCAAGGSEESVCANDSTHVQTRTTDKTNNHTVDESDGVCSVCGEQIKVRPQITTAPTASTVYYGEQAAFTGGEAQYDGVVVGGSWYVDTTTLTASGANATSNTAEVTLVFTPNDTDTYLTATVVINVPVYAVASYNGVYYATVDDALTAANTAKSGTVYALTSDYALEARVAKAKTITVGEIVAGVTLAIPYSGTSVYATTDSRPTYLAFYKPATCRKNHVTLGENVTLVNNGVIQIGGLISGGATKLPYSSFTALEYAQLTLGENAKIINYGKGVGANAGIQCLGVLTEVSEGASFGVINNGGTILAPFTVREHRGGGAYYAISGVSKSDLIGAVFGGITANPDMMPFNRFFLPNITTLMKVENGGAMYGIVDLYANDAHQITYVNLIGNNDSFLIQLQNNAYVVSDYNAETEVTALDIYGDATFNSMAMTIKATYEGIKANVTISTKSALFPITWHYHVGLHTTGGAAATVTLNQSIKIMPGGSLTVDRGVTLNATTIAVYDDTFEDIGGTKASAYNAYEENYPATSSLTGAIPSGVLTVNGTLNVSNLGGEVRTDGTGAELNVKGLTEIVSKELAKTSGSGLDATVEYFYVTVKATGVKYTNAGYDALQDLAAGSYYSYLRGWHAKTVTLTINSNITGQISSVTRDAKDGYTIVESDLPQIQREYYTLVGWFIDGEPAVGVTTFENVEIKAEWEVITYDIAYDYDNYFEDFDSGVPDIALNNPTTATISSSPLLQTPTHPNGYAFDGWYLYSDYTGNISNLDVKQLLAAYPSGNITLYGLWYPATTKMYTITFVNANVDVDTPAPMTFVGDKLDELTLPALGDKDDDTSYALYFDGWYMDENYNTPFDKTQITENTTLYAKWVRKTTVSLSYENKGTTTTSTEYYKLGDTYYTPTLTPEKSGSAFMGWRVESGALYAGNTGVAVGTTDMQITAEFAVKYTVSATLSNASVTVTSYYDGVQMGAETLSASGKGALVLYGGGTFTVSVSYKESSDRKCTVNGASHTNSATVYTVSGDATINASSAASSGCIVEGTLITLYDGSQKKVEDLTYDDVLLVFNHYTGQAEAGRIATLDHLETERELYEVVYLQFSNGEKLGIVWNHGVFDRTRNEYVFVNAENAWDFVGHTFYTVSGDAVLTGVTIKQEWTRIYNPTTLTHMNYFAAGVLNVTALPEVVTGHVNQFELDQDMRYDAEKMQADIEKYGLYTYEDFKDYLSEQAFAALPFEYLKVSVGKGMLTWDGIMLVIEYLKAGGLLA